MPGYIARRTIWLLPTLLGISILMFLLMHAVPGSPWDSEGRAKGLANIGMDAATRKSLDVRYRLDQPIWKQYIAYMFVYPNEDGRLVCGAVCGNLGLSFRQLGREIGDILFQPPDGKSFWYSRFGYSTRLAGMALGFTILVGIPLGVWAAMRMGSWVDHLVNLMMLAGLSFPNFVIGMILLMVFASGLHWIPVIPRDWSDIKLWILPALVLSLPTLASTARLTRSAVLQVIHQDYVRTARAKGAIRQRVIWIHMFKNTLIPILTFLGPALGEMIIASVIIETMFSFPGFGREFWESIDRLDYSMIMAITLVYALMIGVGNLAVEILYGVIDPRVRTSQAET